MQVCSVDTLVAKEAALNCLKDLFSLAFSARQLLIQPLRGRCSGYCRLAHHLFRNPAIARDMLGLPGG